MLIPLTSGAYSANNLIADAQRCVNLFPEKNPQGSPVPYTHYLTPGSIYLTKDSLNEVPWRCLYTASTGQVYGVIGTNVYLITGNTTLGYTLTNIGTMATLSAAPVVYMADNGVVMILVDGTTTGYAIQLSTNTFAVITDPNYQGADRVEYDQTFFIFNVPGTNEWYISLSVPDFNMLTGVFGSIDSGSVTSGGSGYPNGTFIDIALTGGAGTGVVATLTVTNNVISNVAITTMGINYVPGDVLSGALPGGNYSGIISAAGSGYTNGTYTNAPMSGGSGTGITANVTVAGNVVTAVVPAFSGTGYQVGDVLTPLIGGGAIVSGFTGNGYLFNGGNPGFITGVGSYFGIVLTNISSYGTGAIATVNVTLFESTLVAAIVITTTGQGYAVNDVLGLPGYPYYNWVVTEVGGGSGATYTLAAIAGTGFTYTVSTIGGMAFDPLDFATKSGYPDPIQTIIVCDLYVWLIGTQTSEIWFNAGAADFTFQIFPGVFIEHGCVAKYSIARQDLSIYWLSQDKQGQAIVIKGNNFAAHRISTYAIESIISSYSVISDAIGFTYQQNGHVFYILNFPTAGHTWVWDESSQLWHERTWLNALGQPKNLPVNVCCNNGGAILVGSSIAGDGGLYQLSTTQYADNYAGLTNSPIQRIRTFPHLIKDMKRVSYTQFQADMGVGTDDPTVTNDGTSSTNPPTVQLRYSDDRGRTFNNYIPQSMGALGQYLTNIQWRRLGMARDRVFELSWSVPMKTALNAAWITTTDAGT